MTKLGIVGFVVLCLALASDFDGDLPKENQKMVLTSETR